MGIVLTTRSTLLRFGLLLLSTVHVAESREQRIWSSVPVVSSVVQFYLGQSANHEIEGHAGQKGASEKMDVDFQPRRNRGFWPNKKVSSFLGAVLHVRILE